MRIFQKSLYSTLFLISLFSHIKADESCLPIGKIDIGPAYIHLDVLESGHTVRRMDLPAIKADVNFRVLPDHEWLSGICIKPGIVYGSNSGEYFNAGIAVGHLIPVHKTFVVTPYVGYNYTYIRTTFNFSPFGLKDLKEEFRSNSLYLSLEANYTICPGWRISGLYQYAWSRSRTKISQLGYSKSTPEGSSYALLLEYDLNHCWSVNLGAAYNESLTHEKHGIRGYGFKGGAAFWF